MAEVLIVCSSFRKNSNSNALAAKVAEGARAAGHNVRELDISKLEIKPCRACYACLAPNSKGCVQRDGMAETYPLVSAAEVVIFAAPVYWFNLGGHIKNFIDRLFAIAVQKDEEGKTLFARKKVGTALAFGGEDPFDAGAVNAIRSIQDICHYTGGAWAGAVYGKAEEPGEILQNEQLMAEAVEFGKAL